MYQVSKFYKRGVMLGWGVFCDGKLAMAKNGQWEIYHLRYVAQRVADWYNNLTSNWRALEQTWQAATSADDPSLIAARESYSMLLEVKP